MPRRSTPKKIFDLAHGPHSVYAVRPEAGLPAKPKYKIGQLVYSYQNPEKRRPISHRYLPADEPGFGYVYKISLKDKDGYTYSSNFINEDSLSKKPLKTNPF